MLKKSILLLHEIANDYNFIEASVLKKMTEKQLRSLGNKLKDSRFMNYFQWRKWDKIDERKRRAKYLSQRLK